MGGRPLADPFVVKSQAATLAQGALLRKQAPYCQRTVYISKVFKAYPHRRNGERNGERQCFFQCRGMSAAGLKGREACPLLPHKMTSSPMLPKQRYNRTTDRESPFPSPSPFVWLILYASHASERCLSAVRNMLLGDSWAPFQGGLSPVHSCRLLESRLAA